MPAKTTSKTSSSSSSTKTQPAPRKTVVDSTNRRDASDVNVGAFAEVESGEHKGKYGVVISFVEWDDKDGYPTKVIFRTRDDNTERVLVDYDDLKPAVAGRR